MWNMTETKEEQNKIWPDTSFAAQLKEEHKMREHGNVYIPDEEYKERVIRAAKILQR